MIFVSCGAFWFYGFDFARIRFSSNLRLISSLVWFFCLKWETGWHSQCNWWRDSLQLEPVEHGCNTANLELQADNWKEARGVPHCPTTRRVHNMLQLASWNHVCCIIIIVFNNYYINVTRKIQLSQRLKGLEYNIKIKLKSNKPQRKKLSFSRIMVSCFWRKCCMQFKATNSY